MRLTIILGFFSGGALAAGACSWFLEADDCICMNSTNGELLKKQTATICKSMGYQLWGDVCHVTLQPCIFLRTEH